MLYKYRKYKVKIKYKGLLVEMRTGVISLSSDIVSTCSAYPENPSLSTIKGIIRSLFLYEEMMKFRLRFLAQTFPRLRCLDFGVYIEYYK